MESSITPYNFVPLPDKVYCVDTPVSNTSYKKDRYTGSIILEAETLTPIYTRAAAINDDRAKPEKEKPNPEFFHHGDKDHTPIIPGSSVRGMTRSIFEIITNSRMQYITGRRLFYRSFADMKRTGLGDLYRERFKKERLVGGKIVKRGTQYFLQVSNDISQGFVFINAKKIWDYTSYRYQINKDFPVKVIPTDKTDKYLKITIADILTGGINREGAVNAHLIIPGKHIGKVDNRRWYQAIINPADGHYDEYPIPYEVYKDYLEWGDMTHGKEFYKNNNGKRDKPRFLKDNTYAFALLNETETEIELIGANMMMVMRYSNSIKEILTNSYEDPGGIDMSEAVFGKTGKNGDDPSIKTRVFFHDMVCVSPNPWLPQSDIRKTSLFSPKPTSFQLYLKQLTNNQKLKNWEDNDVKLRGFKRYWHKDPETALENLAKPEGALKDYETIIRPVDVGNRFKGKINFENLTEMELYALYASLQIPEGSAHKIGMGKSLGLGSIKINAKVQIIDVRKRYRDLSLSTDNCVLTDDEKDAILKRGYNKIMAEIHTGQPQLWKSNRMKCLGALLSWDNKPDDEDTEHVGVSDRQWKERWILPDPVTLYREEYDDPISIADVIPIIQKSASVVKTNKNDKPNIPVYKIGDKLQLKVISQEMTFGDVLLPTGEILKKQSVGMCQPETFVKFKVLKVDGNGQIKEVTRA